MSGRGCHTKGADTAWRGAGRVLLRRGLLGVRCELPASAAVRGGQLPAGPLGPPLQPLDARGGGCHQRRWEQGPLPWEGHHPGWHMPHFSGPQGSDLRPDPLVHREKACLVDEDSHSSAGTLPGPGASLPSSSGPGLTSPPYTATPIDHDYVKCKKPHQQATPDGTVPVLPPASPGRHTNHGGGCFG